MYDRDFFASNDMLGGAEIDIFPLLEDASLAKRPVNLNKKYYTSYLEKEKGYKLEWKDETSFWLELKDSEGKKAGKIRITIDLFPAKDAEG